MMEKEQINKRQFNVYLINAFGFGWLMQIIVSIYANNNGNQNIFGVFLMLTMYMPFLGTLVAGIPLKSMGCVPHLKGNGINKVALVVFDRNEVGNTFWEKVGFTAREDLVYRNKAIAELVRIDT